MTRVLAVDDGRFGNRMGHSSSERVVEVEGVSCRLDGRSRTEAPDALPRNADGSSLTGAVAMGQSGDPGRYHHLVFISRQRAAA